MLALLFPGQGAEVPRMGLELAEQSDQARALLELTAELTGVDLFRVLRRGGRDLARTEVLQPALTAVCLGVYLELTAAGLSLDLVAGHSLGEIAALVAAGAFGPRKAVVLAARRGALMAREAARHPGGMVALQAGTQSEVMKALDAAPGNLELAAHNAPDEWVVTGDMAELNRVIGHWGGKKLRVAGPWHASAMRGAVAPFREAVMAVYRSVAGGEGTPEALERRVEDDPAGEQGPRDAARWVCNRTGAIVRDRRAIPDLLAGQLVHPVRWAETMATLRAAGVTDVITVGPGRTLRALVRRNVGTAMRVHMTEDPDDLAFTKKALLS